MDNIDLDRVLPYKEWYQRVGISKETSDRLKATGKGPRITRLSERRIGVRERDHLEWLKSCSSANGNIGDVALKVAETKLQELGEAIAEGHVDREYALARLRAAAASAGLAPAEAA
jgi:predicted DNA-binding transcriptional regulator AlpA